MQIEKSLKMIAYVFLKYGEIFALQLFITLQWRTVNFSIFLKISLLLTGSIVLSVYKLNFTAQIT